ncbi:hypothetical protein BDV96DRAFT_578824 [Lophiotrema nucula]|uniref:Uncharacterized protein n=1 Tax=Lophiotrema nucula TaxID=690887 RepID=A0A6A5Z2N6_9PLEO|nr:hypothetical protein BDV96DRAFT_578824 [Lophiotrema nucula]
MLFLSLHVVAFTPCLSTSCHTEGFQYARHIDLTNILPRSDFLQSYVPALDGASHEIRHRHVSPSATIKSNDDATLPFSGMDKMFDMRGQMTSSFFHIVNHVYIVSDPEHCDVTTMLMDWTSTTTFKCGDDKPIVVPEFTVMKLGKAEQEKGMFGLWVKSLENSMYVGLVRPVRDEILAKATPKVEWSA